MYESNILLIDPLPIVTRHASESLNWAHEKLRITFEAKATRVLYESSGSAKWQFEILASLIFSVSNKDVSDKLAELADWLLFLVLHQPARPNRFLSGMEVGTLEYRRFAMP